MKPSKEMSYILPTKFWIEELVVGLNLCPFARRSFEREEIMYRVSSLSDWKSGGNEILDFVYDMDEEGMSNGFLIFPNFCESFISFQVFFRRVDRFLKEKDLDQVFQIVSFHPAYQFRDTDQDDISNYVNRSPVAMIHFLRIEEVAQAIKAHSNIENVAEDNKIKLEREWKRVIDIFNKAIGRSNT